MLLFSHFFPTIKIHIFVSAFFMDKFINIHTHTPLESNHEGIFAVRMGIDTPPHSGLYSAGIHPWDANKLSDTEHLLLLLSSLPCAAIGEIGLDKSIDCDIYIQMQLFEQQLNIAQTRNIPVIIHCVRAYNEIIATLKAHDIKAAIFHGFIGSQQLAKQLIAEGHYISFGHAALRSPKTIEAIRQCPPEAILLETDTSDTPINQIYAQVAAIKDMPQTDLATIIYNTYKKIFQ